MARGRSDADASQCALGLISVTALYACLSWVTTPNYWGDSVYYIGQSVHPDSTFWDFGHLLWRPLLWVCTQLSILTFGAGAQWKGAVLSAIAINWVAGLVCALAGFLIVTSFVPPLWARLLAVSGMLVAQGLLVYSQTTTSYIPGLACVFASLALLLSPGEHARLDWRTVGAGLLLATGILFWFPYVLAAPAVVLSPLILFPVTRTRLHSSLGVALACGCLLALGYGTVAMHLHMNSVRDMATWAAASSHGIVRGGIPRAVFGFANSWIDLGQFGLLVKRYLVHDPLNTVSLGDLIKATLWRAVLFYVVVTAISLAVLVNRNSRRIGIFFLITATPVVLFAMFWTGAEMERYLALYPALVLMIATSLSNGDSSSQLPTRAGFLLLLLATLAVNVHSNWRSIVHERWDRQAKRISTLMKQSGAGDFFVLPGDSVAQVREVRPYETPDTWRDVHIFKVAATGTVRTPKWRGILANQLLTGWVSGRTIYFSKDLIAAQPNPQSEWVEGEDKAVSWAGLRSVTGQFDLGPCYGGPDGFCVVSPSDHNKQVAASILSAEPGHP